MHKLIPARSAYLLATALACTAGVAADSGAAAGAHFGEVLQRTPIHQQVAVRVAVPRCRTRHRAFVAPGDGDHGRHATGWERRCSTVARHESGQERVAYRVKYRYRGRVFHGRAAHRPGKRIRVDHKLEALHF